MSKVGWTEPQRAAIEARNQNLLVAAGAGSGKTAVLVERIIRLISDPVAPVDVDRLLVVTFTNAAAAQMRQRVAEALNAALDRDPASLQLERQLRLLPQARITTLHSFCVDVLRRYYYLLDLDPEFRVADETEAVILRQEILDELFEEYYGDLENDPDFRFLVEGYGGERDDLKLQELVLGLHRFAQSNPRPREWLERAAEFGLTADGLDGDDPLAGALRQLVHSNLESVRYALQSALQLAVQPDGPGAYVETLEKEAAALDELSAAAGSEWTKLRNRILEFSFTPRLPADRSNVNREVKDLCLKFRKRAKERFQSLREIIFSRTPEALLGDLSVIKPAMQRLAGLVGSFAEAYRKAKLARNLVDFSDLEHYCLRVLLSPEATPQRSQPSAEAAEFREYFAEVLVDEYQDINAVQETILQLVSRQDDPQPNLFMVGDVKQSIYRFRLAEPELFLKKYREYPRAEKATRERRLDLTHNFRSRPGIIHAVNFVFRRIMTPAVGELEYDLAAALRCGSECSPTAGFPEPVEPVEVHLLERRPGETAEVHQDGDEEPGAQAEIDLDATQREARLVAGIIRRLITESSADEALRVRDSVTNTKRPLSYRDIVVLMRATTGKAGTFADEFRRLDIPAYAKVGTGYFQATEVETVLSLLKVIDNPRQDIPLAAVLRSPLVELTAADLAQIRLAAPDGDFYQAVIAAAGQSGPLAGKLSYFLKQLDDWRFRARQGSLADLIWAVYRETGYYDYAGAMPVGAERQANLRALHDRARQYEATTFRGLFRFLRFIELIREGGQDLGPAPALAESENVVRIMSIHQSKGLEFPVVILADLGRQFYQPDLKGEVLAHKDLGLGAYYVDPEARVSYPTIAWHVIRERLRLELLSEEMRILYVALTRAMDRLILVGSAAGLEQSLSRWSQIPTGARALPVPALAESRSYLDWLVPVLMLHPDAETLRRAGSRTFHSGLLAPDASRWQVHRHGFPESGETPVSVQAAVADNEFLGHLNRLEPVTVEDGAGGLIDGILSWSDPYSLLPVLPAKVTATEVKRRFDLSGAEEEAAILYYRSPAGRPRFLQSSRGLSGAAYGAAMHLVLQHLDLKGNLNADGIREQVIGLYYRELLTEAEAEAIDVAALADFFAGPLGQRLVRASRVQRELPFYLAVPAREIYPELEDSFTAERVVVQGVVDCLFSEPDGLILVDYKTDRVAPGREGELAGRYRGQVNLYSRAVESILGTPVTERYLYLFASGISVLV